MMGLNDNIAGIDNAYFAGQVVTTGEHDDGSENHSIDDNNVGIGNSSIAGQVLTADDDSDALCRRTYSC